MNKRILKKTDWKILICTILLVIIGLISLYSASANAEYEEFKKQIIWIIISLPIMIVAMLIDYNIIARFSYIFYGIFLLLLVIVLFTGAINGATSWFDLGFFSFQPGELGKVFVVLFLSYIIVYYQRSSRNEINKFNILLIVLSIVLVPAFLIILQPDYGTAIAYIISMLLILFVYFIYHYWIALFFLPAIYAIIHKALLERILVNYS